MATNPLVPALCGLLVLAGVTLGLSSDDKVGSRPPAPDVASLSSHTHDPHESHEAAPRTHLREHEAGTLPDRADAASLPFQFRRFVVRGDEGLAEMVERGFVSGAGTSAAPYVIEGFRVQELLSIEDTTKPLIIRDSVVEGQLTLNYVGTDLYVHHVRAEDLRVTENVDRRGDSTAGLFEENAFAFIGQMRHFSGEFRENSVGPRPDGVVSEALGDTGVTRLPQGLVWNFDGYHLADVHHNTVEGFVDVKLHGHYHGSCDGCASHAHSASASPSDGLPVDHQRRYHRLSFHENTIRVADGPALRFNDEAHAGDDRTAASETTPELELAHEHHTVLEIRGNLLLGGPLVLDALSADDERHEGHPQETHVALEGNHVEREVPQGRRAPGVGAYEIEETRATEVTAVANTFALSRRSSALASPLDPLRAPPAKAAGFLVRTAAGSATIGQTEGSGADYGVWLVRAASFTVTLGENRFDAKEDIHDG
ncbi:MAG: hypothetical protein ACT4PT_11035 [Methanobacteriota archaeon]